jgi:hypothetical protein
VLTYVCKLALKDVSHFQVLRFGRILLERWTFLLPVQDQEVQYLVSESIWSYKTQMWRSFVWNQLRVQ